MRLESSLDHTDTYTDAKRLPRRTAPNVFGMSTDIVIILLSTDGIVFRECRKEKPPWGKLRLAWNPVNIPLVLVIGRATTRRNGGNKFPSSADGLGNLKRLNIPHLKIVFLTFFTLPSLNLHERTVRVDWLCYTPDSH